MLFNILVVVDLIFNILFSATLGIVCYQVANRKRIVKKSVKTINHGGNK